MLDVYRALVRDAADEYSFFKYRVNSLRSLNEDLDDGTICLACPKVGSVTCSVTKLAE